RRLHQLEHVAARVVELELLHLGPRLGPVERELAARVELAAGAQLVEQPAQSFMRRHRSSAAVLARCASSSALSSPCKKNDFRVRYAASSGSRVATARRSRRVGWSADSTSTRPLVSQPLAR